MSVRPFHSTLADGAPSAPRLFLMAPAFPPGTEAGAVRWEKMSHVAVERGWVVDVATMDPESLPRRDDARLALLPSGLRVFGVRRPPGWYDRLLAAALAVRARLRPRRGREVPATQASGGDAAPPAGRPLGARQRLRAASLVRLMIQRDRAWGGAAAALAARIAARDRLDVVASSGPPHFMHEAASRVARGLRIPHVMDMRDPWTLDSWITPDHDSRWARRQREVAERECVRHAALVVCNTEPAARALRARYPEHADRIIVVMNGSDPEARPDVARDPRFLLAYTGAVYGDRSPRTLFEAAAGLVREFGLTPDRFAIEFMGPSAPTDDAMVRIAAEYGLGAFVRQHAAQPRHVAARFLASASLLVSLPQSAKLSLPSKIFEYASYPAWLLALAAPDSATAQALAGSAADVVHPDDVAGIARVLRQRYAEWSAGVVPEPVGADGRFDRRTQAARLFDAIDAVLGRRTASDAAGQPALMEAGKPA